MTMAAVRQPMRPFSGRKQRGIAGFLIVLVLGLFVVIGLFGLVRPATNMTLEDAAQTERALTLAKEALIAFASGRDVGRRPGELPCPDTNNDGRAESNCSTVARQIGRLPWATLGIPDLRDGSGEPLWYAVSNRFKNNPVITPLNSHTAGQLTVTGIAPAANAIAIVFAPGPAIGTQSRTGANINNVAHFLEGDNANNDTVFTTATASATFNDRLLAITPAMFFPRVEMAVARTIRLSIANYFTINAHYPPANSYGATCTISNRGLIPADPASCGVEYASFGSLPSWFTPNQWQQVLIYAVAPACVNPVAPMCTGPGGLLTVNGNSAHAVIISPGAPYAGQSRPCASDADCLEAPNTASYPTFMQVTSSTTANDRMIALP